MIAPRYLLLIGLAVWASLFSECSNKPAAQKNTFGDLDRALLASDTVMEADMDRSYEYTKSLVENDSTVFDFLAYDKPKGQTGREWESKFIVIRRTGSRQDTVIIDYRSGPVRGLSLADLNGDGIPEMFFYENQTATRDRWVMHVYQQHDGRYVSMSLHELDAKSPQGHYIGRDTFFAFRNRIIRRFPYYENSDSAKSTATVWQSYRLSNGKIVFENEKME